MAVSGNRSAEVQASVDSVTRTLNSKTTIFSLKLYVVIGIVAACLMAAFLVIFFCVRKSKRSRKSKMQVKHSPGLGSMDSKENLEIKAVDCVQNCDKVGAGAEIINPAKIIDIETGRGKKSEESDASASSGSRSDVSVETPNIGWGRWYSLKELEIATRGFAEENVIGEGGYGIVYKGVLPDGSVVAVKNLLNNKGQAEKEFRVEVEAIGRVRHKNLVGLIGYCVEGAKRMLVYEFVDNGNLEQWLHGDVGSVSPLTWDIRIRIAIGTAKGLAYLHEGLEPKVVHRDVKSSNILLDRKWHPKVSDFGLAKLLGSEATHVTTRVMGTFGYVSPEYASTGMLNEGSDVYSFGVLLMEIITGRSPIDYSRPAGEMNLVDWFKGMVANRRGEEIVDPLIEVQPSPRALKRVLLVCLRCIDLDAVKRPKMGQIVHMLEADDFPIRTELRSIREKDYRTSSEEATARLKYSSKHDGGDGLEIEMSSAPKDVIAREQFVELCRQSGGKQASNRKVASSSTNHPHRH